MLFADLSATDLFAVAGAIMGPLGIAWGIWVKRLQERDKLENATEIVTLKVRQANCEKSHESCQESQIELKAELAEFKANHQTNKVAIAEVANRVAVIETVVPAIPVHAPLDPDTTPPPAKP